MNGIDYMRSDEELRSPISETWTGHDHPLGCWEWNKCRTSKGYGQQGYLGRTMRTHRLSYLLFRGPIPHGLQVRHTCDNPPCVNPDHLELGSASDNTHDMVSRGRTARKLSDETEQAIRDEFIPYVVTRAALAEKYGCTIRQVKRALAR